MNELQQLIADLNNFDIYYAMSDDQRTWNKWNPIEKALKPKVEQYRKELIASNELSEKVKSYFLD